MFSVLASCVVVSAHSILFELQLLLTGADWVAQRQLSPGTGSWLCWMICPGDLGKAPLLDRCPAKCNTRVHDYFMFEIQKTLSLSLFIYIHISPRIQHKCLHTDNIYKCIHICIHMCTYRHIPWLCWVICPRGLGQAPLLDRCPVPCNKRPYVYFVFDTQQGESLSCSP